MRRTSRFLALSLLLAGLACLGLQEGTLKAQPKVTPIVVSPQAPTIAPAFPLGVQRGQTLELTLTGANLNDPTGLWTSFPAKVTIPTDMNNGKDPAKLKVKLEVPADAPIGFHSIRLATKSGVSNARLFCVDELPQIDETADNRTREKAQVVPVPGVVVGRTDAEVSDYFKFTAKPGQRLTIEVIARRLGSTLDPMIRVFDAKTMREMPGFYSDDEPGLQSDCRLTRVYPSGGEYIVEVRDSRHVGGGEAFYRLRISDAPNVMAAMPVAVQRGQKATIAFAGKDVAGVAPVEVSMPADGHVINVVPKGPGGSGWPVPVLASNIREIVEVEPNNDIAKAQRIELPVGITGRFLDKSDLDCFVFAGKKGVKYAMTAETYEINSPAEVFLVVKDAKGAELARSNPAATPARIDFTAPADGDFVIVAEHLNYAHGPVELYHLIVEQSEPDFTVNLMLDRFEAAPGGMTLIPVASVIRKDYAGPIELVVQGPAGIEGSLTFTAPGAATPGIPVAMIPLNVKPGTALGGHEFRVIARATVNGKVITRQAQVADIVKASLNALAFPPAQMLSSLGVAVTAPAAFTLTTKLVPAEAAKGVPANLTVTATRVAGFAEEIALSSISPPANVTLALKPIPKGANEVVIPLTTVPATAVGTFPLILRGNAKVAGKDVAFYSTPMNLVIVEPKKEPPKKEEPKKVEPKKVEPKKEEPKKVEPKKEEPKKVEPKKVEPKKVEPKKEEPKKVEPKKN